MILLLLRFADVEASPEQLIPGPKPDMLENILCPEKYICLAFGEEHKTPSMHIFQILKKKNVKRKSANMITFHKSKLTSLMSAGNRWDVHTQDRQTVQPERTERKGNSTH